MAALSATKVGDRIPQGRYVEQTFSIGILNTSAADEWIDTGMSEIVSVVGYIHVGGGAPLLANFQKNSQGTSGAVGSSLGDLGVEAGGAATIEVTVRGKA